MFGYVVPDEGELKVKELALYRAYYCGLCKTIGDHYGQKARLFLNYDCSFLALLLSGLTDAPACETGGCIRHIGQKRPIAVSQPSLKYAAAMNVLLSAERSRDELRDERSVRSAAAGVALWRAERKAADDFPEQAADIAENLKCLAKIEKTAERCTDVPADAFGNLMRNMISKAPGVTQASRQALEWMFYNLGRWIYLIDAWDDREKDSVKGTYNPFLTANTTKEEASFLIGISLSETEKGYDLVPLVSHSGVLDNIVHKGLKRKTMLVLEGRENEPL